MFCTSPITIYKRGNAAVMNAATGEPERAQVACGHCRTCKAGRKNDWAGRLVAEAKTAKSVYFVTLTYKKEPADYNYLEVQKALKHLRTDLVRNHGGTGVRFFCVGERGNKFGRIHWHLLLFFDRPHYLRRTKPRELWQFWQHGWTNIEQVPSHDIVRRVRYCAKYAVKDLGSDKSCRLRCSLKPAIGGQYVRQWSVDLADAGLPLKGFYTLPGMVWERGHRKGEHVRYRLRGSSARTAARVFAERWEEVRPKMPWPVTPFFARYYPEQLLERRRLWPHLERVKLGRIADGQAGRLSFRERPKPFFHLNGVAHVVDETEEQAAEREAGEQYREQCERERLANAPRVARRLAAAEAGLDLECVEVNRYIESGCVGQDGDQNTWRKIADIIWAGRDDENVVDKYEAERQRAKAIGQFLEGRFAEQSAIWQAGFASQEWCDQDTGEVFYRAVKRERGERSPKEYWVGPEYRASRGGLSEQASRRSVGSAQSRDTERAALEARYKGAKQ